MKLSFSRLYEGEIEVSRVGDSNVTGEEPMQGGGNSSEEEMCWGAPSGPIMGL